MRTPIRARASTIPRGGFAMGRGSRALPRGGLGSRQGGFATRRRGFSLIELVVTMAIIGILAAIAIPSYLNYTRSTNRTDATRTMTVDAQALERCYSQNFQYTACAGAAAGSLPSSQGYYTVTIAFPTAQSYTITAAPLKAPQTGDTACWSFTLNSAGTQKATTNGGADNTATCWGST